MNGIVQTAMEMHLIPLENVALATLEYRSSRTQDGKENGTYFTCRDEIKKLVRKLAVKNGFQVRVKKGSNKRYYGWECKAYGNTEATNKIGCPFRIETCIQKTSLWHITHINFAHNHPLFQRTDSNVKDLREQKKLRAPENITINPQNRKISQNEVGYLYILPINTN